MSNDEIMEMLADDRMKHAEAPEDATLDDMYDAMVGSASEEYRTAH